MLFAIITNERKYFFLKCNSAFFLSRISLQYLSEQIKYIEVLNALHDQDHMVVYTMGRSKSSLHYPNSGCKSPN